MDEIDQLVQQLSTMGIRDTMASTWPEAYASVGTALHPASTERLMEYWAHGEGAAKIRWPEPCAFCRCLEHVGEASAGKMDPARLKGHCANLEKRATGHWPNPEHSKKHHCPC